MVTPFHQPFQGNGSDQNWVLDHITIGQDQCNRFSVPYPEVDTKINEDTKYWITGISEDAGLERESLKEMILTPKSDLERVELIK